MTNDYSKATLERFLSTVGEQGLINQNTATGWKAAVGKILGDVPESTDVRTIEPKEAVRRYHNKYPGKLMPSSMKEYERRLVRIFEDFVSYVDDPINYKGRSRDNKAEDSVSKNARNKNKQLPDKGSKQQSSVASGESSPRVTPIAALSFDYPLRADFLAQVVVPRDLKSDEARRLTRFIMTLAQDFDAEGGGA